MKLTEEGQWRAMSWPRVSPGAGASESRWADILGPDDAVRRTSSGGLLKGSGNEIFFRHLIRSGSLRTATFPRDDHWEVLPDGVGYCPAFYETLGPSNVVTVVATRKKIRKKTTQREFSSCLLQWLFLVDDRWWAAFFMFLFRPLSFVYVQLWRQRSFGSLVDDMANLTSFISNKIHWK